MQRLAELEKAYDFFNIELFGRKLPDAPVYIRKLNPGTLAFTSYSGFGPYICFNARHYNGLDRDTCSTVVHEQCHIGVGLENGHNNMFARAMEKRGLIQTAVSADGAAGGHRIQRGGVFDVAYDKFKSGERPDGSSIMSDATGRQEAPRWYCSPGGRRSGRHSDRLDALEDRVSKIEVMFDAFEKRVDERFKELVDLIRDKF